MGVSQGQKRGLEKEATVKQGSTVVFSSFFLACPWVQSLVGQLIKSGIDIITICVLS